MKNNIKSKKQLMLLGIVSTLGLSLAGLSSVSAWGPERDTFTMKKPATYPVFNSITDNPTIGDERNFVRIGQINADVTDLTDEVEVLPGHQYLVYIYFHNNASATFNDSAHNHSGVAWKTYMSSSFSTVLTPSSKGKVTATITAENTNPLSVWDEAYFTTKTEKVLMHYVAGSAKIYNDWGTNNTIMPSALFTKEGTPLGLNAFNGVIPGCEEYHGVVSYVLEAEELGGSIDKAVTKDGDGKFVESVNLAPGETATYQLTVRNTGDVALSNATIKDVLPQGLTLVPGSVKLRANASETWDSLTDEIFTTGYNLGTIGTGNVVYIQYQVTAGEDFDCKGTELSNKATLTYDSDREEGETKEDTTTITVKKTDCDEPEPDLDDCTTNPGLPECQKTCITNPEMEECQELPNTGPLEIVLAIVIIAGICGGGYYFYRTKKALKNAEGNVSGKKKVEDNKAEEASTKEAESEAKTESEKSSSEK